MKITTPKLLFFSDIHLDPSAQDLTTSFCNFISKINTEDTIQDYTIFILGDLFESWIGDDELDTHITGKNKNNTFLSLIITQLKILASKTPTYFMHGNRDFLIGKNFEEHTGIQCLKEIEMILFHNFNFLLCHGDHLCTQDTDYIAFRNQVRNVQWQQWFTSQTLDERRLIAQTIRNKSKQANTEKPMEILDIAPEAAKSLIEKYQPDALIHGHTHRPGIHDETSKRIVLGDWDPRPSWLSMWIEEGNLIGSLHARDWTQPLTISSGKATH